MKFPPLAGTLYYAVVLDSLLAPAGLAGSVAYSTLPLTSDTVVQAAPDAFVGGLVANGSVAVSASGAWHRLSVRPPCVSAALCAQSLYALRSSTAYRAFIVSEDQHQGLDPVPVEVAFSTPAGPVAPVLLPPTGPGDIGATSFNMQLAADAAGGVNWMLVTGLANASLPEPSIGPGGWQQVAALPTGGSGTEQGSGSSASNSTAFIPGQLVPDTCPPANATCAGQPAAAFDSIPGLASSFEMLGSGCAALRTAGQPLALPTFQGLSNNTLYYVLLSAHSELASTGNQSAPPLSAVYAVKTIDTSPPRMDCGFPLASNITSTSFALSAMLTKPAGAVFFVVLPADRAGMPPSAGAVVSGRGSDGAPAAAAGRLLQGGWLPWEAAPSSGGGNARKQWAAVSGLAGGGNYSAFLVVSTDGSTPAPGATVATLTGILTPATMPPSFTAVLAADVTVDEGNGTFVLMLQAEMDRPGTVRFAMYRRV